MRTEDIKTYHALTAEWTRNFCAQEAAPLVMVGVVNNTNRRAIAISPQISKETAIQIMREAIDIMQGGGIILPNGGIKN